MGTIYIGQRKKRHVIGSGEKKIWVYILVERVTDDNNKRGAVEGAFVRDEFWIFG
jgi:hypothetical protein